MQTKKIIRKEEALSKAMAICSKMEKCKFDISQKLHQWGIPSNDQIEIIERLEDLNFLNEERYVKSYIKQKIEFNKWGKIKIRYALSQKKISADLMEEKFNEIDSRYYFSILMHELEKKNKTIKTEDKLERKGKLIRFATNHGFEYDIVINGIEKLIKF